MNETNAFWLKAMEFLDDMDLKFTSKNQKFFEQKETFILSG